MTATTRAEIEQVVRRLLDEKQQDSEFSLRAIQHVSALLTDEVLPNLATEPVEEDDNGTEIEGDDNSTGHLPPSASLRRSAAPRALASAARSIRVQPGVKIGPTGRLLVRIL